MTYIIIGAVLIVLTAATAVLDVRLFFGYKSLKGDAAVLSERYNDVRKRDCSGQASWGYACVRFVELINDSSKKEDGGILAKVRAPFDGGRGPSCRDIVDAGKLLAGMGIGEVYHVSTCEFLVFTPNCRETAGKVFERFKEFGRENLWYAVAAEPFISSEQDINRYLRRMKQGIAAAEVNECRFAIY